MIQGRIYKQHSQQPLAGVMVTSYATNVTTHTDTEGRFTLLSNNNDSLLVQALGCQPRTFSLSNQILADTITIAWSAPIQLLDSIIVNRPLSKYQIDSLERLHIFDSMLSKKFPSTKVVNNTEGSGYFGLTINGPISGILSKLSRKNKRLKRFQNGYQSTENEHFLNFKYNEDVVMGITDLDEDQAGQFINQFPIELDFARTASDIEIKMWILYNYKNWRKQSDTTANKSHHHK
jgi:hypothetical protein